jgi:hypothetical protein
MIQVLKRPASKIAQRQLKLREQLWPDLDRKQLWLRKERAGFTTIPRSMPLILSIIDSMSKGKPLSSTYLELWCRAHDECLVTLTKQDELAFHAGFTGQRAITTWRDRMRALAELGFIEVKPGPSGELSYALILNPYHVIKKHRAKKTPGLTEAAYNALQQRAIDIGADDLE